MSKTWQRSGNGLLYLIIITLFSSALELLGFGLIMPIINISVDEVASENKLSLYIKNVLDFLNIDPKLSSLLMVITIIFVLKSFFVFLAGIVEIWICTEFKRKNQIQIIKLLENVNYSYHLSDSSGYNLNLVSKEVDRYMSTLRNISSILISFISIVIFLGSLLIIDFLIVIYMATLGFLFFFIFKPIFKLTVKYSIETSESSTKLQRSLVELIFNFSYLKATNRTEKTKNHINLSIENLIKITRNMGVFSNIMTVFKEPVGIIILAILIFIKVEIQGDNISEVLVIGIILYRTVQRLLDFQHGWQRMNEAVGGLFVVEEAIKKLSENKEEDFGNQKFDSSKKIEFKNVFFNFENNITLKDLSFSIQPNKVLGITGPSGSGKSTIVNLITKLLVPTKGKILSGNVDFKNINNKFLRDKIGYVTQNAFLLDGTLEENISFWDMKKKSKQKIRQIISDSGLEGLTKRLNENITEAGKNLSGGQKQRITIARELFRKPELIIFDEPTSALDNNLEKKFKSTIRKLKNKHTIIIISHNLSILDICDDIIVLEKGRLVQKGSFKNLKKKVGLFKDLIN